MVVTLKVTMKRANVSFNYHDYRQLPEDKRFEILDGELCMVASPNIRHLRVARRLKLALIRHVEEGVLGEVFDAPCDVLLSDENVLQPDILFVQSRRGNIVGTANIDGAPDLVIEVLSPGTRARDLEIKRKIYARFGVQEYWIVDPEADTAEVLVWSEPGYASAGVYGITDRLSSPLLPELNLPLSEILRTE